MACKHSSSIKIYEFEEEKKHGMVTTIFTGAALDTELLVFHAKSFNNRLRGLLVWLQFLQRGYNKSMT